MKQDVVIKVEGLSKQYSIGKRDSYLTLRDKLMELPNKLFKKTKKPTFWALKDVSFEVKRGEVLGVIGRNGAGKSTLLKILARITEPTKGKITMRGRVASMLEVGTGFNPELTGRENIYLNGSILGMSRTEIQSKFDEITDFAGIGEFLDTPVKHYSSGMYVRLAFAVAAHLDSDILLVDEVLAVGDAEFQKKCLGKMSDLSQSGKTVIFVSHNFDSVNNLCNKAILLSNGELRILGKVSMAFQKYYKGNDVVNSMTTDSKVSRVGNGNVRIETINIYGNNPTENPLIGENITIQLNINKKLKSDSIIRVSASIRNFGQRELISLDSELIGWSAKLTKNGLSKLICRIINPSLNSGDYELNVALYDNGNIEDWIAPACTLRILPKNTYGHVKSNQFPILAHFTWKDK